MAASYDEPQKMESVVNPFILTRDEYTVDRLLGEGAFGKVYLVSDVNKKHYAMKTYTKPSEFFSSNSSSRFEVDLLSRAIHPNIVHLLTLQLTPGVPEVRIVMELAEMNLLEKFQKEGVPPLKIRRQWFHDFLSGMALLHNNGYLHCDIKLENLLIMSDGILKVADPGISFNKSDVPPILNESFNCGVLYTKAPEYLSFNATKYYRQMGFVNHLSLLNILPKHDFKVSINRYTDYVKGEYFSIGVVLLEILAGHSIYSKFESTQLYFRFLLGLCNVEFEERITEIAKFVNSEGHDKDMIVIVARLLSGNPENRPSPFVDVILEGYERLNQGRFEVPKLPSGRIPDNPEIEPVLLQLVDRAQVLNYTLYQLANAMSLFWYVLPRFKTERLDYLAVACLFMIIRRSSHIKVRGTDKFTLNEFARDLNAELLRDTYTNIYRYMNGFIHVESIGDYANDGTTLVHSFGYYIRPTENMQNYVILIQGTRPSFTNDILVNRMEFLSHKLIYLGKPNVTLGSVVKQVLREK